MDLFNDLVLKVYRAARELPVGEFQDAALGLVRERLRFNSAVWAQGQNLQKGVAVHSAHLYNEPLEMILDWQRINDLDLVVEKVTRNVGHAQNVNARALYPGRQHSVMREFSSRYGHQNLLIIGLLLDYVRVGRCWLALYRPDANDQYGHTEVRLLDALAPHLFEALRINRTIGFREHGHAADLELTDDAAIARTDGVLNYCGRGFLELLRREWPSWQGFKLPDRFLESLPRDGKHAITRGHLVVAVKAAGDLLFLRVEQSSPLRTLTPRECTAATLYAEGRSYKEIARDMGISPATVRNFLQHTYSKLHVRDKAELARILLRGD
jgi:DNA-binding CsgD family transcriptional regulator